MFIRRENSEEIFDRHYSIRCPHCQREVTITAMSLPRYESLARFRPPKFGVAFKCDGCLGPIFASFVVSYDLPNGRISYDETKPEMLNRAIEPFEYEHLPAEVAADFREAAECYSIGAYNGFAALCRRTIQTMATHLGAPGKEKIQHQVRELEEIGVIGAESMETIRQIVIDGHDGAHPHLPSLSAERAGILLELMKDVLYQAFVRKAKLEKATRLRQQQIAQEKPPRRRS